MLGGCNPMMEFAALTLYPSLPFKAALSRLQRKPSCQVLTRWHRRGIVRPPSPLTGSRSAELAGRGRGRDGVVQNDVEVRIYLTVRDSSQVEWQVTRVTNDGQVEWEDGQIYAVGAYKPLVDRKLSHCISTTVRRAVYRALSFEK